MFDFDVRAGSKRPEHDSQNTRRPSPRSGDFSDSITTVPRRPPVVVAPSWTIREAFGLMIDRHASMALIASHGVLLGTLSEREIVRHLMDPDSSAGSRPVFQAMLPEPETLMESDTVAYAVQKLWTLGGRAMPIVRSNGAVFGVLETQDLVSWMCGRVGAAPQIRTGRI
jgi:CBS domain-containing protein